MSRRESTVHTAQNRDEDMLPVSPRQLVSEEGGIINLEVDNEFDVPEVRNLRPKKIRGVKA